MTMTDPIADMLTRVRNASSARKDKVEIPASQTKIEIARILNQEGYIKRYEIVKNDGFDAIIVTLKYGPDRTGVIKGIKRISTPGLRVYARKDAMPRVLGGLGIAILSTSRGVMTEKQAGSIGVGGEVMCYVW
ncbi:MAG: 30S ribosomal protein S8 [Candidatus Anoxymicrobium japonicum]|uniref:Small ribosomal subunit protein uS8 n=1 Tax=Candidatus Anoxymicrobium japonicum TaxID=2013648 RepID=A0A2N3G5Z0_9ACTN|nr:ribosomal protein S8 [uncultured bacterium]PKQ28123.1 MAG: 30S ribosomal protein S8 [Candidatus Anoxymicrobium japonicum]